MSTPSSGAQFVIRQSCGYDVPIHGIAMAGFTATTSPAST